MFIHEPGAECNAQMSRCLRHNLFQGISNRTTKDLKGMIVDNVKPQVDRFVFPRCAPRDRGCFRPIAEAPGHPSFAMSSSFAVQVLAQLNLLRILMRNQGLQEQCPPLAEKARRGLQSKGLL